MTRYIRNRLNQRQKVKQAPPAPKTCRVFMLDEPAWWNEDAQWFEAVGLADATIFKTTTLAKKAIHKTVCNKGLSYGDFEIELTVG